jgi:hypothetical protein
MMPFTGVNRACNAVFEPWFGWLAPLPVPLQVGATAIPVTLFALVVFRYASDQAGIRQAKDRIKAHLLELWLYKDDPAVLLRAQGSVVVHSLAWLGYSLLPLAIMIVPLGLVIVQLETQFAFRALPPGEPAILVATLADGVLQAQPARLGGEGVVAETPALRVRDRGQLMWRVRAAAPGVHVARIDLADAAVATDILAGAGTARLSPAAYREDDWRALGYPAARALPAGAPVTRLELEYPRARGEFLGLSTASWMLLAFSLLLGFAMRGMVGVTF